MTRYSVCFLLLFSFAELTKGTSHWTLVWHDEFGARTRSQVDPTKWAYDIGAGGWGNHELETYTNSIENVFQDGNGHLVIRAMRSGPDTYSSGRIKTLGKFEFRYARVEARMKLSSGQGLWPAFWMLGASLPTAGWPACGEIDIMEHIGKEPQVIHGTVHGPGYSGAHGLTAKYDAQSPKFRERFHVFRVDWELNRIRFYVDDHLYSELTPSALPPGTKWVFNAPFGIILNLAVGGDWPGTPDSSTAFPQEMIVDWVRVWQR